MMSSCRVAADDVDCEGRGTLHRSVCGGLAVDVQLTRMRRGVLRLALACVSLIPSCRLALLQCCLDLCFFTTLILLVSWLSYMSRVHMVTPVSIAAHSTAPSPTGILLRRSALAAGFG